ncbi:MAG: alpha/beta fold hydrolase [Oceanicaulis sp.]
MGAIRRGYIRVNGVRIHARFAGSGPAIVLLHQSPRSSAEYEPLIEALSERYFVFAPDTPGNGDSEALAGAREVDDYAAIFDALLDKAGVGRCVIYGYHTGASLAAAAALHAPHRYARAILNGLCAFDTDERADITANYLRPIVPDWSGSHLAWAWARMREQMVFFPWYDKRPGARMTFPMAPAGMIHAGVVDLLRATDYAAPYGAAFRCDARDLLAGRHAAMAVWATPSDPLRPHLDRVAQALPGIAARQIAPGLDALIEEIDAVMAEHSGELDRLNAPSGLEESGRCFVGGPGAQLHIEDLHDGQGAPVVVLPDYGAGLGAVEGALRLLSRGRRVVAVDLPGFGGSAPLRALGWSDLDDVADGLAHVLHDRGVAGAVVVGWGLGAALAAHPRLASAAARRIDVDPLAGSWRARLDAQAGLLEPDWAGGHLQAVWHAVRDSYLFSPWYDRRVETIRRAIAPPQPARLQAHVIYTIAASPQAAALLEMMVCEDARSGAETVLPATALTDPGMDRRLLDLADK